jgi:hypothetical protein
MRNKASKLFLSNLVCCKGCQKSFQWTLVGIKKWKFFPYKNMQISMIQKTKSCIPTTYEISCPVVYCKYTTYEVLYMRLYATCYNLSKQNVCAAGVYHTHYQAIYVTRMCLISSNTCCWAVLVFLCCTFWWAVLIIGP